MFQNEGMGEEVGNERLRDMRMWQLIRAYIFEECCEWFRFRIWFIYCKILESVIDLEKISYMYELGTTYIASEIS